MTMKIIMMMKMMRLILVYNQIKCLIVNIMISLIHKKLMIKPHKDKFRNKVIKILRKKYLNKKPSKVVLQEIDLKKYNQIKQLSK